MAAEIRRIGETRRRRLGRGREGPERGEKCTIISWVFYTMTLTFYERKCVHLIRANTYLGIHFVTWFKCDATNRN